MSFAIVGGVITVGLGVYQAVEGQKAADIAKKEADKARLEMEKQKDKFEKLDTSNPYLDMENMMEDLTINQQQAEFEKQQAMQSQADVLQRTRQAAGSSGIAALAQTLAKEGTLQAQKASADIGKQETVNQQLAAKEAAAVQLKEREGEIESRKMERGKIDALMGLAAGDVSSAQAAQLAGQQQVAGGVATAVGGVGDIGGEIAGGAAANAALTNPHDAGTPEWDAWNLLN